jgi:hypothetical protein
MKFNKLLMGIKDTKYKPKPKAPLAPKKMGKKDEIEDLAPIEEEILENEEDFDDVSLNSDQLKEENLRKKREALEEAEIEEVMEQIDLEGGLKEYEGGDDSTPASVPKL